MFRQQLTGVQDPDLVLLSVVAGCVENCMTTTKLVSTHSAQVLHLTILAQPLVSEFISAISFSVNDSSESLP